MSQNETEEPATEPKSAENAEVPISEDKEPATEPQPTENAENPSAEATEPDTESQPKDDSPPIAEASEPKPTKPDEDLSEFRDGGETEDFEFPVEEFEFEGFLECYEEACDEEFELEEIDGKSQELDNTIKVEDLEYMLLAKDISEKNKECEQLKNYIDERLRKKFRSTCEDREIAALQKIYAMEYEKLEGYMRDAMDFRDMYDDGSNCENGKRKTTIDEDLAAARMLKELCAPYKCASCPSKKKSKKIEEKTCKSCGARTGKKPSNSSEQLVKIIEHIDDTLKTLRTRVNEMKQKRGA